MLVYPFQILDACPIHIGLIKANSFSYIASCCFLFSLSIKKYKSSKIGKSVFFSFVMSVSFVILNFSYNFSNIKSNFENSISVKDGYNIWKKVSKN